MAGLSDPLCFDQSRLGLRLLIERETSIRWNDTNYCTTYLAKDLWVTLRLLPAAPYEAQGFYPNVVFSCGATCVDDQVTVFYGAGDSTVASAQISLVDVLNALDASPAISA